MTDARFEDGVERPVKLRAETAEDVAVLSALLQDAVTSVGEIAWTPKRRRFSLLVNRFRWEDAAAATRERRPFERVQAMLTVGDVLAARSNGVDPSDKDTVVSILSLAFEPGAEGAGTLRLLLAGDGEIALAVECLDATLEDVSRPYLAPSGKAPKHALD